MLVFKRRPTLANWLLVVVFLSLVSFVFLPASFLSKPGGIEAILGTLALYLVFCLPALYFLVTWLVISLLVLIPPSLLVLLLVKGLRRRQRERAARRQFPAPITQHEDKPLPWMQRRFNAPTQL